MRFRRKKHGERHKFFPSPEGALLLLRIHRALRTAVPYHGTMHGAGSACAKSSDMELGNGDNHTFGKRTCSVIVERW